MAAAVRTIEGQDKQDLIVTVPIAYSLDMPPGIRINRWGRADLIAICGLHPKELSGSGGTNEPSFRQDAEGQPDARRCDKHAAEAAHIPNFLNGFAITSDGAPVDEVKYRETRARAMESAKQPPPADQSAGQEGSQQPAQPITTIPTLPPAPAPQ